MVPEVEPLCAERPRLQARSSCGWASAATVLSRDARQQRLLASDTHRRLPAVHWEKVTLCEKRRGILSRRPDFENLGAYCFYLLRGCCCCCVGTFILWKENMAPTPKKNKKLSARKASAANGNENSSGRLISEISCGVLKYA